MSSRFASGQEAGRRTLPAQTPPDPQGGLTLAVAGKGGVGKTTFAALLVRALLERGVRPVLAVDADPNSNLGQLLGLEAGLTVGALRERTFSGPQAERERPAGWDARTWMEYRMQEALAEGEGFDLLVMGRPEGPGCYCYANSLLREYMQVLAEGYRCVVVDNEAGLEHLSRRLCRGVDALFVLDDGSRRARQAADRILELVQEVDVLPGRAVRVSNGARPLPVAGRDLPEEDEEGPGAGGARPPAIAWASIPYDELLAAADLEGRTVFALAGDSTALKAVHGLLDACLVTAQPAHGGISSVESRL